MRHIIQKGGSVTNPTGSTLSYIYIYGGPGSVTNAGRIVDTRSGVGVAAVGLQDGGSVLNASTGYIGGYSGIYVKDGVGTVTNDGNISGLYFGVLLGDGGTVTNNKGASIIAPDKDGRSLGVWLAKGGKVSNAQGATISVYYTGILSGGAAATVTNAGSIAGVTGCAMRLLSGGSVTNDQTGTITGRYGVYIDGASGAVTNSGVITGTGKDASGVHLVFGGTLTNEKGATIAGGYDGVYCGAFGKDQGIVTNAGTITGSLGEGVDLHTSGTLTNLKGATISGYSVGAEVLGGGTITNAGSITSTGSITWAVFIDDSGELTNEQSGSITAPYIGVLFGGSRGTVSNAGAISGSGSLGVGVYISCYTSASVTNSGTISGKTAAVEFDGSGANSLTLETGSVLHGSVIGSTANGATNALVLEGHGTADNQFLHFNTLSVQANGTWTLGGKLAIAATTVLTGTLAIAGALTTALGEAAAAIVSVAKGATLTLNGASILGGTTTNSGTLLEKSALTLGDKHGDAALLTVAATGTFDITTNVGIALGSSTASSISNLGLFEKTGGGSSHIAPAFANDGKVQTSVGTLDFQSAMTGTGTDTISGAATLEFDGAVAKTQTIDFTGASSILDLGSPIGFLAALSGFDKVGSNDAVELLGSWSISGFASTSTRSTLTLTDGDQSVSLVFDGSYSKTQFDPKVISGHTTITYT